MDVVNLATRDPLYHRIFQTLQEEILAGAYDAEAALPSDKQLEASPASPSGGRWMNSPGLAWSAARKARRPACRTAARRFSRMWMTSWATCWRRSAICGRK